MIFWKDKIILDTSGGIISSLCYSVDHIIGEQNLSFNKDITKLLHEWYVTSGYIGFDVAEYIHTKKDLAIFADLVRRGIDRFYIENPGLPQYTINNLEGFYKELLEIQKTLPE